MLTSFITRNKVHLTIHFEYALAAPLHRERYYVDNYNYDGRRRRQG